MRRIIVGSFVLGLSLMTSMIATAQERVPSSGSSAVGIDVGAFVPQTREMSNSPLLNALYEYYVTPRASVRTEFGFASPSFNGGGGLSQRDVPLRLDLNYNWKGGRLQPFIGTGFGVYFLQFRGTQLGFGDTETKLGFNLGGGIEFFVRRKVALKAEGRYHAIANVRDRDPSGMVFTLGLKTYF